MTPKEQEIAIKELEERVDRLRNIYEQYFLGFERLEPTVARKDVDRRLAILRKEQIRNTAMRFRFNVVTQKYNTYAMHWVRICRQIEEGTYKRHVRRAKARFGELSSSGGADRDLSIDIDIDDFDMDVDMDQALAAVAETLERPPADPAPPPASDRVVEPVREARPAALPPGAKPRVLLRKREDGEAPSGPRSVPAAPSSVGAQPAASAARPPGSSRAIPVAASSAGAPSAGRIPAAAPASSTGSVPRVPAAPSIAGTAAVGRPSGPQIRPLGSSGRLPVAAPASAPGSAAPRVPAAPPLPPGARPGSSPRVPVAPVAGAGPGSSPRVPVAPARPPMPSHVDKNTDPAAARPPGTRAPLAVPLPSQAARPPVKKE